MRDISWNIKYKVPFIKHLTFFPKQKSYTDIIMSEIIVLIVTKNVCKQILTKLVTKFLFISAYNVDT